FATQSSWRRSRIGRTAAGPVAPRVWTSAAWLAYFRANAYRRFPVPWEAGAGVTDAELAAIARSLQAWQLGETSDRRHLRAPAARYAARAGDADYPAVIDLFIREEQHHGALLGRFLDLAGVGRRPADWGDTLFRTFRYCLPDPEVWTTPVVMVETLALIYYHAIRRATRARVLRAVCGQILADEVPPIRFQCERLAAVPRARSPSGDRLR